MKKFITLLVFAGFLTTATFAQSGHRHNKNKPSNGYGYPNQNYGSPQDTYTPNMHNDNGGYTVDREHSGDYGNSYGYGDYGDRRDREGRGWEDHRRTENYYPGQGHHERMEHNRRREYQRGSWFEVIFSNHDRR